MANNKQKPATKVHMLIGKPITPIVHRNVYKLVINNMHGDADGTTFTKTFFERHKEPLLDDILLLLEDTSRWILSRDQISDRLDEICKKHIKLIDPDDHEYYDDYAWELIDHDYTYPDYICRPTLESLTFFNDEGVEHTVNLQFKYGE